MGITTYNRIIRSGTYDSRSICGSFDHRIWLFANLNLAFKISISYINIVATYLRIFVTARITIFVAAETIVSTLVAEAIVSA